MSRAGIACPTCHLLIPTHCCSSVHICADGCRSASQVDTVGDDRMAILRPRRMVWSPSPGEYLGIPRHSRRVDSPCFVVSRGPDADHSGWVYRPPVPFADETPCPISKCRYVALLLDVWVSFGLGVVVGGCRGRALRGR
jgi:hypothetical protein